MGETPLIYISKYYTVNRDEETLLFDGTYLRDGMIIVFGDVDDRMDSFNTVGSSKDSYELNWKNRFCTISNVYIEREFYGRPQVSFIATYEDGVQIKRTHRLSASWIVRNDSIPAEPKNIETYTGGWKDRIEQDVMSIISDLLEEPKRTIEEQTRAISRIMKLIGDVISDVEDYRRGELGMDDCIDYSKKDAEAVLSLFEKSPKELGRELMDMLRDLGYTWAEIKYGKKTEDGSRTIGQSFGDIPERGKLLAVEPITYNMQYGGPIFDPSKNSFVWKDPMPTGVVELDARPESAPRLPLDPNA